MPLSWLAFVLLVGLSSSCAGGKVVVEPPTKPAEPGIYDVRTGDRIERSELFDRIGEASYVLVAESHDNPADHAIQVEVVQELAGRGGVAIGMEMFQRPFQAPLDAYVAGEISEAEMLEQTEWEDRWGFATELYAPLWQLAAERKLPLVALNLRRELTKRISGVGLDGLTEQERADLPEIDQSDERYREWMREIFRSHGAQMESVKMDRFYQAQLGWDETMADTAVHFVEANDTPIVIIVGRGHVERDWGIPSRIRRRIGAQPGDGTVVSIVPVEADAVPRFGWMRRERFADYVWVKE